MLCNFDVYKNVSDYNIIYKILKKKLIILNFSIIQDHIYTYTGWPILIHPVEYLENQARERKMFQTKVIWFRGGHKMVLLVWPWRVIWRSREGHFNFFKWNTLYIFAHSCSLSRELSKTLQLSTFSLSTFWVMRLEIIS